MGYRHVRQATAMNQEGLMEHPWLKFYDHRTPHRLAYPEALLDHFLDDAARDFPTHTAITFVLRYALGGRLRIGATYSYQQLHTYVDRLAAGLASLGVGKGDRVALMLPNSPQAVIAFFAAMRLGAIVVNTNPTYMPLEIQHQLADSGAETIVLLNQFVPRLRKAQPALPQLKRVIVTSIDDLLGFPMRQLVRRALQREPDWAEVPLGGMFFSFSALLGHAAAPPQVTRAPGDVALLQYTGGTTGVPKAAMLTHRNLLANTLQSLAWLVDAQRGAERMICALPFFHVYGMTVGMLCSVAMAANMLVLPNPRPIDTVMEVLARERATIFPGVPAMYIAIINHPQAASYDLTSVRACLSAAAPLPIEVQERFGAITGGRLVEGYGMTETSPLTHGNPVYGLRKSGSIGIPVSDVDAKIVDLDSGAAIAAGTDAQGELLVRGPQVMAGYWERPDETAATIDPDGWLHTGDIARMDEDGYFFIVDRKKDMIIASGFKVLPRDVEEVLFTHPDVQEAAVVGVPDPYRGETVKAYIVPKAGAQPSEQAIIAFCREQMAPFKVPRQIEFRTELPKTPIGKVLRRVLVDEERQKLDARASSARSDAER
jgi:long-chain acyl-CoA synthetase